MLRPLLPAAVAVAMLSHSAAMAAPKLVSTDPPAGATVHTAPTTISITFSDKIDAKFSSIVVLDERNQRVQEGAAAATSYGAKTMSIAVKPLTAGVYRVIWHLVAADGSKSKGKYEFTVAP
jgi:copper resistance protein C